MEPWALAIHNARGALACCYLSRGRRLSGEARPGEPAVAVMRGEGRSGNVPMET
jgi:hypothetical protein